MICIWPVLKLLTKRSYLAAFALALQVYLGLGGQLPTVPTILLVPEFAAETDFAESVVANRVLVKPFDPAVLLEAVTVLLESHRAAAA